MVYHLFCQVYHDLALKSNGQTKNGMTATLVASVDAKAWRNPMQRLLGYIIIGLVALIGCVILFGAMRPTSAATVVYLAATTPTTTVAAPRQVHNTPLASGQFSVLSQPQLSPDFLNQILAAYHSPAAGTGQALYNLGRAYGINSDFALAFFGHESSFGTQGEARSSLSLGNLRCIPNFKCQDGYAWFPSWEAGFQAWYALIRNLYVNQWGLTTIEQIIPRYAPPSDNNNDAAYIYELKVFLTTWYAGKVQP